MRISWIQRTAALLLLSIMFATLFAPTPKASTAVKVPLDFDKPASTFTGTATVTCFTSPDSSWLVLQDLMNKTQNEMLIMVYALTNGFFVNEIENALARNNSMEIKIIVSWKWASHAERSWTKAAFYNLSQHVAFENNLWLAFSEDTDLEFTHAKFMIFDRETVVVESCNWAKSGVPPRNSTGNREWGVAIQQPDVVNYFLETFTHDWTLPNVEPYTPDSNDEDTFSANKPGGSYTAPFENQTFTGNMDIQCVLSPDNDITAIKELIQSANSTLDVQQMYIKEDWHTGFPNQFLEEILAARLRGVTCRVILDIKGSGNAAVNATLVAAGVGVVFQGEHWGSSGSWMHNKGVIVDGKSVLISSINWSNESVSQNREAGVIITHPAVAGFFANVFQYDWENGEYQGGLDTTTPTPTPTPTIPPEIVLASVIIVAIVIIVGFFWQWYKKKK